MAWTISADGKTVLKYTCTKTGIRLETGQEIPEGKVKWTFAVHPDENPRCRQNEQGEWEYCRGEDWILVKGTIHGGTWVPMKEEQWAGSD
jgi:hypothetical protein